MADVRYVGRFAPSPTGPLHLGSLTTALASYLDAKQHRGRWLLRIEDIDPPREAPGAADAILGTLETLELHWDALCYQSNARERHEACLAQLLDRGLAFRCTCSRADIRDHGHKSALGYRYPGTCRRRNLADPTAAVRVRVEPATRISFEDRLQGRQHADLGSLSGDYVVWRRDRMPAYHLAGVADDAAQGVTDVVRGIDLMTATMVHAHLQDRLGLERPRYAHLPVVVDATGQKLSKQTGAPPITADTPQLARTLLAYLGIALPDELERAPYHELWEWASDQWRPDTLRSVQAISQR